MGKNKKALMVKRHAPRQAPPLRAAERKKVLIVDDDRAIRAVYVPYFSGKGYDAVAASSGKEALVFLETEKIALMILDLCMPETPGEEVLRAMAANTLWKEIPIIIDTALDPTNERLEKIRSEFEEKLHFDFFQKSASLEKLSQAIGEILIL